MVHTCLEHGRGQVEREAPQNHPHGWRRAVSFDQIGSQLSDMRKYWVLGPQRNRKGDQDPKR